MYMGMDYEAVLFDETCLDLGSIFRCGSIWWKNISDVFHGQTVVISMFSIPLLCFMAKIFLIVWLTIRV